MIEIYLRAGREASILRRHPWVYAGAIAGMSGTPQDGETVDILDSNKNWLARGAYSAFSKIRIRIWTWDAAETISEAFFKARLEQSISLRQTLQIMQQSNACRLVNAESDGLPGLIVDQYDRTLVVQFLSSGAERWRDQIIELLAHLTQADSIFERSDAEVRKLEGLPPRVGLLKGIEPLSRIRVIENDLQFWVDIRQGHKTGFYLDQRISRRVVASLATGRKVLDCFCYTGGFTLSAINGGATSVVAVDESAQALEILKSNLLLNEIDTTRVSAREGDVFRVLRELRDRGDSFDLIVLDPPKFAATAAHVESAARGYKDINLLAMKLLKPGGLLATFSCSGNISLDLFQKIVAGAAVDARVDMQILDTLFQAPDHPVALSFPDGAYLKGFVLAKNRIR
jgi:23S rRNA (cytosine1962-C5)-methyltransferase